jgi:hypothetical protein
LEAELMDQQQRVRLCTSLQQQERLCPHLSNKSLSCG